MVDRITLAKRRVTAASAMDRAQEHVDVMVKRSMRSVLDKAQRALAGNRTLTAAAYPVDPAALAQIPTWWGQAVDEFTLPALLAVFRNVAASRFPAGTDLPDSFGLDFKPASEWVRQSQNRLKNIGDDIYDGARQALADGIAAGESIDDLSKRLTAYFDWNKPPQALTDRLDRAMQAKSNAAANVKQYAGIPSAKSADARDARSSLASAQQRVKSARAAIDDANKPYQTRALTIARTETTAAFNVGDLASMAQEEQVRGESLFKIWVATLDSRTREAHAAADGQKVPIGEPFSVDGEDLMYPGDPAGSPANVIECRCSQLAVGDDDEVPDVNRQFQGDSNADGGEDAEAGDGD